jgi:hypothetical protein
MMMSRDDCYEILNRSGGANENGFSRSISKLPLRI